MKFVNRLLGTVEGIRYLGTVEGIRYLGTVEGIRYLGTVEGIRYLLKSKHNDHIHYQCKNNKLLPLYDRQYLHKCT
jgi:hypothetical protein